MTKTKKNIEAKIEEDINEENIDLDIDEEDINDVIKQDIENIENKKPEKPLKTKRTINENQRKALDEGRRIGLLKKQEISNLNKQKKEIKQKLQIEDKKEIEELKKVADFLTIDKKIEELSTRFNDINSKISEMYDIKKKKNSKRYQDMLKQQIREKAELELYQQKSEQYKKSKWDYL
jgi:hypothetical protein